MAQLAQMAQVGGNTKTPTNKRYRVRRAVFVLNNWSETELAQITQFFDECRHLFIIGKEIGNSGTPHLQGYVEFSKQVDFKVLKKLNPKIHWEKAKGNKKQNIAYCSKDGECLGTLYVPDQKKVILAQEYNGVIWKNWQKKILDLIEEEPDNRAIHWFWEKNGNVGKSFLCKYLALTKNIIICSGKSADIFNQIKVSMDGNNGVAPKIIILDVPRSHFSYINYSAIESIKNGLIYSGKYEGGQCCFLIPHVLIFANEEPDIEAMSFDRWKIEEI